MESLMRELQERNSVPWPKELKVLLRKKFNREITQHRLEGDCIRWLIGGLDWLEAWRVRPAPTRPIFRARPAKRGWRGTEEEFEQDLRKWHADHSTVMGAWSASHSSILSSNGTGRQRALEAWGYFFNLKAEDRQKNDSEIERRIIVILKGQGVEDPAVAYSQMMDRYHPKRDTTAPHPSPPEQKELSYGNQTASEAEKKQAIGERSSRL